MSLVIVVAGLTLHAVLQPVCEVLRPFCCALVVKHAPASPICDVAPLGAGITQRMAVQAGNDLELGGPGFRRFIPMKQGFLVSQPDG